MNFLKIANYTQQDKKATYGELCPTCTSPCTVSCDDTIGLSCSANAYCTCSVSTYFWNGTYCGKMDK